MGIMKARVAPAPDSHGGSRGVFERESAVRKSRVPEQSKETLANDVRMFALCLCLRHADALRDRRLCQGLLRVHLFFPGNNTCNPRVFKALLSSSCSPPPGAPFPESSACRRVLLSQSLRAAEKANNPKEPECSVEKRPRRVPLRCNMCMERTAGHPSQKGSCSPNSSRSNTARSHAGESLMDLGDPTVNQSATNPRDGTWGVGETEVRPRCNGLRMATVKGVLRRERACLALLLGSLSHGISRRELQLRIGHEARIVGPRGPYGQRPDGQR
jgi:hypothetical protein